MHQQQSHGGGEGRKTSGRNLWRQCQVDTYALTEKLRRIHKKNVMARGSYGYADKSMQKHNSTIPAMHTRNHQHRDANTSAHRHVDPNYTNGSKAADYTTLNAKIHKINNPSAHTHKKSTSVVHGSTHQMSLTWVRQGRRQDDAM